jgi:glycosyltransferase involved in cell wall biosynthesis
MDPTLFDSNSLVSVVIPTRYRPDLVRRAVVSVLAQTYRDVEVLVVIDGPDSETETALSSIKDSRLRVLALKDNVGGSEARNIGAREGHGKWVAFLDDDDEWFPEKIAKQKAAWETSSSQNIVVFSSIIGRTPTEDFHWPRRFPQPGEAASEYLFCRKGPTFGDSLLHTSTIFAARQFLLDVPFLKGLKKHQDWDWLLRVAERPGVELIVIREPLAIFHIGGQRKSVSRAADWKHSLEWALSNRQRMTGRAFSFFLAIECASQACTSRASLRSYSLLLREYFVHGSPTLYSLFLFFVYGFIPQEKRKMVASFLNKWKQKFSRANRSQTEFASS